MLFNKLYIVLKTKNFLSLNVYIWVGIRKHDAVSGCFAVQLHNCILANESAQSKLLSAKNQRAALFLLRQNLRNLTRI